VRRSWPRRRNRSGAYRVDRVVKHFRVRAVGCLKLYSSRVAGQFMIPTSPSRTRDRVYDPLFTTPEMAEVFSGPALVRQMLRFECALAQALERNQVIPEGVAAAVQTISEGDLDRENMAQMAVDAGNLAIPFVSSLTSRVAERSASLADHVHYGATSQDVLDTAMVLQAREGVAFLQHDLEDICDMLVPLISNHRSTMLPGRTWLQQAPPVTFGFKLAGWLDALLRHRDRLQEARARCIVLQFGGAVGTLAALGDSGPAVSRDIARFLELPEPSMPWHTHRDRVVELASTLGMITGTLGKIARDVSLLMQTEVAEVFEPAGEGRGGSSTMPHKKNPVFCSIMLAAAMRAPGLVATMLSSMVQEHERGLGGWQAEWESLPELFRLTAGSVDSARRLISGIVINVDTMREHLDANGRIALSEAVSFALAAKIGKRNAHKLLEEITHTAMERKVSLREALIDSPSIREHLSIEEINDALDPQKYQGSSQIYIANVLAREEKG
jgi:3-carboxy-cis,cis-muconate cycloisomerase